MGRAAGRPDLGELGKRLVDDRRKPRGVSGGGDPTDRLSGRFAHLFGRGPLDLPTPESRRERRGVDSVRPARQVEPRLTGGATVAYPDLGGLPAWMSAPDSYLTGDADELAEKLVEYRDAGVGHILTNLYPFTPEAVDRYGEAVQSAKEMMGA